MDHRKKSPANIIQKPRLIILIHQIIWSAVEKCTATRKQILTGAQQKYILKHLNQNILLQRCCKIIYL